MNRNGFLSSGKIPSAKGYSAPRVRTLVMWKSEAPLPLPQNIHCTKKLQVWLAVNLKFNKNVLFLSVTDEDNNAVPALGVFT